jgi:chromosome condensin MukBEF complex kleisin-like MukF subunit
MEVIKWNNSEINVWKLYFKVVKKKILVRAIIDMKKKKILE